MVKKMIFFFVLGIIVVNCTSKPLIKERVRAQPLLYDKKCGYFDEWHSSKVPDDSPELGILRFLASDLSPPIHINKFERRKTDYGGYKVRNDSHYYGVRGRVITTTVFKRICRPGLVDKFEKYYRIIQKFCK